MRNFVSPGKIIISGFLLIGLLFAGILIIAMNDRVWIPPGSELNRNQAPTSTVQDGLIAAPIQTQGLPAFTPTPDVLRKLPALRSEAEQYYVQPNDSLHTIARNYLVSVEALLAANEISQPDYLEVGQELTIPAPQPQGTAPDFKVIPDSELVYSPGSIDFQLAEFVHQRGGYLASYTEEVDDRQMSGE